MLKDFKGFIPPMLASIGIFFLLRLYEFFLVKNVQPIFMQELKFELLGFLMDIAYILVFTIILSIVLVLSLSFINKKLPLLVFKFLLLLLCIVYIPLIKYFAAVLYPLDGVLFSYPIKQVFNILSTGTDLGLSEILPFIFVILCFFGFNYFLRKTYIHYKSYKYFLSASFLASPFLFFSILQPESFNKKIDYYLFTNKLYYLIANSGLNDNTFNSENIHLTIWEYRNRHSEKKFKDPEYPLLHENNSPNVLGRFFNLKKQKPNIVVLMVESLSRLKCGKDARFGSFSPFLDSLSRKSLYWKNFLSCAERTFGVLPSSLASLPHGPNGFTSLNEKMTNHFSLISLLKHNGYTTSFYCGANIGFDNMGSFLAKQGIDHIMSFDFYRKNGVLYWGPRDEEVYKASLRKIDSLKIPTPRLDVYLTLSSHDPWDIPNDEVYAKKTNQLMEAHARGKGIPKESMSMFNFNKGILYTDDQLRFFLNEYKKRDDYENTIFVIFGDHGLVNIEPENTLAKYHIPLIIFSPLLNQTKTFESISTQLDLAPTLLSLLNDHYQLQLPDKVHWLGTALDTTSGFNKNRNMAFMNVGRSCKDYISGDYFMAGKELFKIEPDLNLTKITNHEILKKIERKLFLYKEVNNYVCLKDKMLPPDYFSDIGFQKKLITEQNIQVLDKDSVAEYINLLKLQQDAQFKNYSFILEGELWVSDTSAKKLPSLVVVANEIISDSTLSYQDNELKKNIDGDPLTPNQWNKIILSQGTVVSNFKPKQDPYAVKIYLWNPHKTIIRYRNLKLTTFGLSN